MDESNIHCFTDTYPTTKTNPCNTPPLRESVAPAWTAAAMRPLIADKDDDYATSSVGLDPMALLYAMPGCSLGIPTQVIVNPLTYDPSALEELFRNHDKAKPFIKAIQDWQYFKRFYYSDPCVHKEEEDPISILVQVLRNVV